MKKGKTAVVAAVILTFLNAIKFVQAAPPIPSLSNAFITVEDFLLQGYLNYTRTIDFTLTFILITVVSLLGAKRVFQDQARQARMLSIVLGLISAYALVMGAGFSWLGLPLLWKFLFGWIALTLLFAYMGMKRLWAALIALGIMLVLFYMGGWLIDGDGTDWFRNLEGHSSHAHPAITDKGNDNACVLEGEFPFDSAKVQNEGEIKDFVSSCQGEFTIIAYTSAEGTENRNKELVNERRDSVKDIVKKEKPDARVSTKTETAVWEFTGKGGNDWNELSKEEKKEIKDACNGKPHNKVAEYEKYLAPNRRFVLECDDCSGSWQNKENYDGTPKSCRDLISELNGDIFDQILNELGKDKHQETLEKLSKYENDIQKCKEKLDFNDAQSVKLRYDLLRAYNIRLGESWVMMGSWKKGQDLYKKVVSEVETVLYNQNSNDDNQNSNDDPAGVPVVRAAIDNWEKLLREQHFKPRLNEIPRDSDLDDDQKEEAIESLNELIDEMKDANTGLDELKFYRPRSRDNGDTLNKAENLAEDGASDNAKKDQQSDGEENTGGTDTSGNDNTEQENAYKDAEGFAPPPIEE